MPRAQLSVSFPVVLLVALAAVSGPTVANEDPTVAAKQGLVLRHFVNGDVPLSPRAPDEFTSMEWWVTDLRFDRDAEGRVVGLRIDADGGRVRGLRMTRLAGEAPQKRD